MTDWWWEQAACQGMDREKFFPRPGGEGDAEAKRVCAGCPVRSACLRDALSSGSWYEVYGVWGGTNQNDRRGMKLDGDGQILTAPGRRTCKRCGGPVQPGAAKAQKLCDTCRGPKPCAECSVEFQPSNPDQQCCSHRCAGRRLRRRNQERTQNRPAPVVVEQPRSRPRADLLRELATPAQPTRLVSGRAEGIKHGTPAGYRQHRYRGVEMCDPCRAANARRDRERRAEQREELEKVRAERPTPAWPPPAQSPRADLIQELAAPAERSA